eukprot:353470-Chlamydomonas_euryale.AAC.4
MFSNGKPRAPAGARGYCMTRRCLLKQGMGHGPQKCHQTVVVQKSALGTGLGRCDVYAWPGRRENRKEKRKVAASACTMGDRGLLGEGDRDCLLLGSRKPGFCWLAWLVSEDHGYSCRRISQD